MKNQKILPLTLLFVFVIISYTKAQIQSGTEYTMTTIEAEGYIGTYSRGTYDVKPGFGYTNSNAIFIFEKQNGNIYKIKAKTSGRYLRASDDGSKGISAKNQTNDDYSKFKITKNENGTYEIQVVANDYHLKYNSKTSTLDIRKSRFKKSYFIIASYQEPSTFSQPQTLKKEVKIRNVSLGRYLAYDVMKGGLGPLKLGGYFEEQASWKVLKYPNGKISFVIAGAPILAKGYGKEYRVARGNSSVGSPDAMWKLIKVHHGVLIKHVKTNTFLSLNAENGLTLTTVIEDPRAVWQLEQKKVRIETVPSKTKTIHFATVLNGGEYFGFTTFEHSPLMIAQKSFNGEYSNWKLIKQTSGHFKLQNLGNDKYLSIVAAGDGVQLKLTEDKGDRSNWSIKKLSIGGFELKNKATNTYIRTKDNGMTVSAKKVYGQWFFEPRKDITSEILGEIK